MLSFWSNLGSAVLLGALATFKGEVFEFYAMTGILSVKVTSPVTHMFSSAARSVLQVALGVKIFGDVFTTQRGASVLTILMGTLLYTYVKSREPASTPARPAPQDIEAGKAEGDKEAKA
ncbi:hypothetical protein MPER_11749 [Moniliophthora perniciosa FA553]|nr:hypothetical protein MPER_11749 [Moniliophthora perniciosa FA553]